MHFPPVTSVLDEVNTTEAWRDLKSVLTAHDNVKVALNGHFHKAREGRERCEGGGRCLGHGMHAGGESEV